MARERTFRVRLIVPNLDALHHLAVDYECMPMRRRDDGMIEMEAIATESALQKLRRRRKSAVLVEVLGDRDVEAAHAMRLVSSVNRYANGVLPLGPGTPGRAVKGTGDEPAGSD
jgi:hypothetical protein